VVGEAAATQDPLNQEQPEAVAVVLDTVVVVVLAQQVKATQEQELQIEQFAAQAAVQVAPQLQDLAAKVIPKVKAIWVALEYTQPFYLRGFIMQAVVVDRAVPTTETVICGSAATAGLAEAEAVLPALEIQDPKAGLAARDLIVEATVLEKSELVLLDFVMAAVAVQTQAVEAAVQAAGAV
jgi:hypothetical protein